MKKVAVLGLGRIGKIHLKNLVGFHSEIIPIAITSSVIGRQFAKGLKVELIYDSLQEVLQKEVIDACIICSPSDTHYHYVKILIERGADIFCEKPLDLSIGRIQELEALAERNNIKLMVAFNRRFDPNFSELKKNILDGRIGKPQVLKITSKDPGLPPLDFIAHSGGIFLDMIIHDFDMCRFLLEEEVTEIYTKVAIHIDPSIADYGDYDTAVSILTFSNGAIAIIDNSREAVYGYDQRVEIFGSKGMLTVDNRHPVSLNYFGTDGALQAKPFHFFMDRYSDSYRYELDAFLRAVLENSVIPVTATDAKQATKIALAAMQSVNEKRPISMTDLV